MRSYRLAFVSRRIALPRTEKHPIIIHAIGKEDSLDTAVRRHSFEIDKTLAGRSVEGTENFRAVEPDNLSQLDTT